MKRSVIIYGISNAGIGIIEFLRQSGVQVIVAVQAGSPARIALDRRGIPITEGHLEDISLLAACGAESADALILSSENEHQNLEIALAASCRYPSLRIVLRLFNLNLARGLTEAASAIRILSVSSISSPSFAGAALIDNHLLSLSTPGGIVTFRTLSANACAGMTVREAERELNGVILALDDAFNPSGECSITKGATVTLCSTIRSARDRQQMRSSPALHSPPECGSGSGSRFGRIDGILGAVLLGVAITIMAGTTYFVVADSFSPLNALYFVITIITTTGFGDFSLKDSSSLSRVIGIILMLSGVTLSAMLFALLTDTLVKKRLDIFLGRKKSGLSGHLVLCGLGDVGSRILERLLELEEPVVVVEKNSENRFIPSLRDRDIPLIVSDATLSQTLLNAGIERARGVICATDDDMRNLEIGISARSLHPGIRVVLRIFERDFACNIERCFDIHVALSSSHLAAPAFAAAALDSGTAGQLEMTTGSVGIRCIPFDSALLSQIARNPSLKALFVVTPCGSLLFETDDAVSGGLLYYAERLP